MDAPPAMPPTRRTHTRASLKRAQTISSPLSGRKGKERAQGGSPLKKRALKRRLHVGVDGRRYFENMDGEMVPMDGSDVVAPPPYTSKSTPSLITAAPTLPDTLAVGGSESEAVTSNSMSVSIDDLDDPSEVTVVEDSQQPEDLLVMPQAAHYASLFEETQDPGMVADCEESYVSNLGSEHGDHGGHSQENQAGPSGSSHSDADCDTAGAHDSARLVADADLEKFSPRQNAEEIIHRMRMQVAWSEQMQARMAEVKSNLAEEKSHRQMSHWDLNELKAKLAAHEETISRIAAVMGAQK